MSTGRKTMIELPKGVRSLFTPPFSTDKAQIEATGGEWPFSDAIFLVDANGHTAASRPRGYDATVPRGHGWHIYLPNGPELHDLWCAWYREVVPPSATLEEVVPLLNEAWGITAPTQEKT